MSKRLQVVVDDTELHEYEETAKVLGLTLSAWVRQNLRKASRDVSRGDVEAKLAAIRRAASYRDGPPSPDIEQMNAEIERGYLTFDEA
jgi:hypothetical protein